MPNDDTADGRSCERHAIRPEQRREAAAPAPVTGSLIKAYLSLFRRPDDHQERTL